MYIILIVNWELFLSVNS